jgi:ATP-dependent exoDNAse (exonuclease V) beta subunit
LAVVTSNPDKIELSPEQLAAIGSTSASLVVSAAAGSGKTRVLVERYLKHVVEEGFGADQILAITFTRKAAAVMKRRIVDRLVSLNMGEQAQIAETGPIQTIHGFCERLLRENAIAAAIDPEFEILSEAQSARLMEEALQEAFAYPPEDALQAQELLAKMAGKRTFGESFSPHAKLESAVRDAIYGWRGTGVPLSELMKCHQNPVALLSLWREKLLASLDPQVQIVYANDHSNDSFAIKLTNAYKQLKKRKPAYIRPSVEADLQAANDVCGLMQLACEAWQSYESKMRKLQKMDFTALESSAVALLKNSISTQNRLRDQYPIVLIDEAQDLNPIQYELLSALKPKTEMFVGDRQQSIYGFRQADVKLFASKMLTSEPTRLSLNYRSTDGILGFVDHIFGALWQGEYTPMLASPPSVYHGVELWIQKAKDTFQTAEWVRDLVGEMKAKGRDARDIAILVRKSQYAIALAKKLDDLGVPSRISGGTEQFYTRLEVRDVANAMEALTDPYDDFALSALLRSPFVGISLDSLVLLAQSKPIIEQLRNQFLFLSDSKPEDDSRKIAQFMAWFEPAQRYADRLSAWEIIGELFAKSPYLENLARREDAAQKLANVRKLLSLAAEEPETNPRDFAERIREIQAIRHKEGDAPAGDQEADEVSIMTIHKSKGLEFPIVVLPDTHEKLSRSSKDVEVDPALRLITTKFDKTSSMFHEWLAHERQERETEEEWRVMYVALTRAQERLCVVVNPQGGGDKIADRLCRLLNFREAAPPGVKVRPSE